MNDSNSSLDRIRKYSSDSSSNIPQGNDLPEDPKLLRPSKRSYIYLMDLISKPITTRWTPENRAALWRYRYWLQTIERALPKFVNIIDWDDSTEVAMIADILLAWSIPTIWTCIELMAVDGPYLSDDIDLLWASAFSRTFVREKISIDSMIQFLPIFLEYFGRISRLQNYYPLDEIPESPISPKKACNLMADFLIEKSIESESFAQQLFWSVKIRSKEISMDSSSAIMDRDNVFARLLGQALHKLQLEKKSMGKDLVNLLFKEESLFQKICRLLKDSRLERLNRSQRVTFLRKLSNQPENGVLSFNSIPLPYDYNIIVNGTLPDRLGVYKSNVMPVKIIFVTEELKQHAVIVKAGEDVRNDMMALNILRFFDNLWQKSGIDLKVTSYRCCPLSLNDGMLEFVPSQPLSFILSTYQRGITGYLGDSLPSPSMDSLTSILDVIDDTSDSFMEVSLSPQRSKDSIGLKFNHPSDEILDNFVRSCAGYSVFTYILGVGDRHLDNLLLCKNGRLFHIDFAYMFGKDPKPFPPPMKICREMIEAMGGPEGDLFIRFKEACFAGFSVLRRQCRIVIPFIDLYAGDNAAKFVHEKLLLNFEDVQALVEFEKLIDESITALFPKLMETLHKWAQYWRQ